MKRLHLDKAFALFSEESKRLEKSYLDLQKEFSQIQKQLHESYLTLSAIVANLGNALIAISYEGKIVVFNEDAATLLAQSSCDVIARPYAEVFEDTLFGFSIQQALIEKTAPKHLSVTLERVSLEITTSFVADVGILILMRDVTELKALRLAQLNNDRLKEIGEMAATLAHEIRNPLGGIEGFASLLQRDLADKPRLAKMASHIAEGSKHLESLVTEILIYAKPLKIDLTKNEICSLIEEITLFYPKTVVIKPNHPLFAKVDPNHLKRAFFNILKNGWEFAQTNVTIKIKSTKDHILISFHNDGPPIEKENLKKLFTPFFTTKTKGTGLGLSESHKIICAHGGEIRVDSEENRGTTFTIQLATSL